MSFPYPTCLMLMLDLLVVGESVSVATYPIEDGGITLLMGEAIEFDQSRSMYIFYHIEGRGWSAQRMLYAGRVITGPVIYSQWLLWITNGHILEICSILDAETLAHYHTCTLPLQRGWGEVSIAIASDMYIFHDTGNRRVQNPIVLKVNMDLSTHNYLEMVFQDSTGPAFSFYFISGKQGSALGMSLDLPREMFFAHAGRTHLLWCVQDGQNATYYDEFKCNSNGACSEDIYYIFNHQCQTYTRPHCLI